MTIFKRNVVYTKNINTYITIGILCNFFLLFVFQYIVYMNTYLFSFSQYYIELNLARNMCFRK